MTCQCDKDEFPWRRKDVDLLSVDESLGGGEEWWQSEAVYGFLFLHDGIPEKIIMITSKYISCFYLIYPLLNRSP